MSRVLFKKHKSKHFSIHSSSLTDTSASELSYLKAEVWSLQNHLRQEKICIKNLSELYRKLANEKYELLEEITRQNISIKKLHEELDQEREFNEALMSENEALQDEQDKNHELLEKAVIQNVNLKQLIVKANEKITRMGFMYLELKEKTF